MPNFVRLLSVVLAIAAALLALRVADASEKDSVVRVGVLAFRGSEAAVDEWSPLVRRLEAALPGRRVELVRFDLPGLRRAVRDEVLEFFITNPGQYVELEAEYGASRILTLDTGNGPRPERALGSVVIVPRERADLQTLEDLRGRRLAIVGRSAFGGFQLVAGALQEHGMSADRDLAGLHEVGFPMDGVVAAIDAGKADAGVLRSCLLERRADWMARFRVMSARSVPGYPCATSTQLYPDWPLAALRRTPPELARAVAIALLAMDPERDGMAWVVHADYRPVHELFRRLGIGPYDALQQPMLMVLAQRYWPWVAAFALLFAAGILYTVRVEYLVQSRTAALSRALAARESLEESMRAAQEQADHMARLSVLGELSGTLAHELNQPLAAITNYAHSLERRADHQRLTEAAVREAAAEIAGQAERAAGILGRIRGFSRKRAVQREACVPRELVDESVALFRGMIPHAPEIAIDDAAPATALVEADRLQIQQVLLNLLKNAYDASRGLAAERQHISIALRAGEGRLRIAVRDYGSGLDETARTRLFEAFFTTKPDGLGLGLSICRSIAEAHGGQLAARLPDEGPGVVFVLSLPILVSATSRMDA